MVKKGKGPQGEDLPPGLTYDPVKRRYRIQPAPGMKRESVGPHKGRALDLLRRRRAELKRGKLRPRVRRAATLDALARDWYESQDPEAVPSLQRNFRQYEIHIAPLIGKRKPDDVRPADLIDVFVTNAYETTGLSAASVHNLRGTLSAIFEHGRFHELCDTNPCARLKRRLPSKRKQKRPCYSDTEAALLMTDPRVPDEWRIFYALAGVAGLRSGEVAGLRWRDLDLKAPILGSLFVGVQYDDRSLKTATGDDGKERVVPVHPMLRAILARWRLSGWLGRYGRMPTDDDRIVPDARTMGALTPGIVSKRAPKDCEVLGIPNKGMHGMRRFFITYARRGGARPDVLERITHNAKGGIIDTYTNADGMWAALCEAVQCLALPSSSSARTLARTPK